jgi:hypothetical protein
MAVKTKNPHILATVIVIYYTSARKGRAFQGIVLMLSDDCPALFSLGHFCWRRPPLREERRCNVTSTWVVWNHQNALNIFGPNIGEFREFYACARLRRAHA